MGLLDKLLGRTWRTYRDRGQKLLEKEEPGLALHEFKEALRRFDGDPSEKLEMEQKLISIRKTLRQQQLMRAEMFHKGAQFERARDAADSALRHATNEQEEQEVHDFMASLEQAASEAERKKDEARNQISNADADLGMVDERFSVLLGALDNEQMEHYEKLGSAFREGFLAMNDGDFKGALQHFKKARQENDDDAYVLCEQGKALLGMGAHQEAAQVLLKSDTARNDSTYIKLQLVQALWVLNDFPRAEQALQEAHDIDPGNERVLISIAEHSLRAKEYASGIDAVNALLDRSPNDISLLRLLGQLHQGAGDLDKAVATYEGVLKLKWNLNKETGKLEFDPTSAFGAAMIYIEQERKLNRAIDLLHAMLSVTNGVDTVNVYLAIAKAYEIKKKPRLIRETLQKALEAIPEQAKAARGEILKRIQEVGV